jgi:hypothetical protein
MKQRQTQRECPDRVKIPKNREMLTARCAATKRMKHDQQQQQKQRERPVRVKNAKTEKWLQHGVPQPKNMKQQRKQRECPVSQARPIRYNTNLLN